MNKNMYDFTKFRENNTKTEEHYKSELSSIRTGHAAPSLLDGVKVDSYGTMVPINQVGSVTSEDARTIRVSPWELDAVHQIEQAIQNADLGVSVSSDEKGVRVSFPELTSERREQLIKLTKTKLEEARVSVRKNRDAVWNDIQKLQKNGEMSEDEKFKAKEDMEKITKEYIEKFEEMAKKKEEELNS